jgi:cysteine-rich repeat protein
MSDEMRSLLVLGCGALLACGSVGEAEDADAGGVDAARPDARPDFPEGCGDGELVFAEECDDENHTAGDGCSPACLIEPPPGAIAVRFRGAVTGIQDPLNAFSGQIAAGEPVRGLYIYDPGASDGDPLATLGVYDYGTPGLGLHIRVAAWRFSPSANQLTLAVFNEAIDQLKITEKNPKVTPPLAMLQALAVRLEDASGRAFLSDALPDATPDPRAWTRKSLQLIGGTTADWRIDGTIESFE